MKKVGTITASAGLIYLGVWMILRNTNDSLSNQFFKWWPTLLILLGIEIVIYFGGKDDTQKIGFNFLAVVVLLVFVGINAIQFTSEKFNLGINWLNKNIKVSDGIEFFNEINAEKYKVINSKTTLSSNGNTISFNTNNGDIRVRKSNDASIKVETNIYVDKNSNLDKYDINAKEENDGYSINMNEGYIKKEEIYLYVPEKYNIKIESNNLRVVCEDTLPNCSYIIKANNGSVDLSGGENLQVDFNNGSIKVNDINSVKIKSDNGSISLNGNIENIILNSNNGAVNVNNKLCKDIDIHLNLGVVKFYTEDKNIDLSVDINHGPIDINGEKRVNSSFVNKIGTGEGKVKIGVDNGAITVKNQE